MKTFFSAVRCFFIRHSRRIKLHNLNRKVWRELNKPRREGETLDANIRRNLKLMDLHIRMTYMLQYDELFGYLGRD